MRKINIEKLDLKSLRDFLKLKPREVDEFLEAEGFDLIKIDEDMNSIAENILNYSESKNTEKVVRLSPKFTPYTEENAFAMKVAAKSSDDTVSDDTVEWNFVKTYRWESGGIEFSLTLCEENNTQSCKVLLASEKPDLLLTNISWAIAGDETDTEFKLESIANGVWLVEIMPWELEMAKFWQDDISESPKLSIE
ncbi:MAG: hypothetical protein ABJN69_09760 [Hellea sp.]